jgi:putative colanic acid biosynthesis UDP-glucose lipid carrier transferase
MTYSCLEIDLPASGQGCGRTLFNRPEPMSRQQRQIEQHWSLLGLLHRSADAACIGCALWLSAAVRQEPLAEAPLAVACGIIAFYLLAEFSGLYRSWQGASPEREAGCVLLNWFATAGCLLAAALATPWLDGLPHGALLGWLLLTPVLICLSRAVIRLVQRMMRARGLNTRRFAVVGISELGFHLARNIDRAAHLGLKLGGFYDDRPAGRIPAMPADLGSCVGNIDQLVDEARRGEIDIIYITFPMRAEQRIRGVLDKLGDTTASVYLVPDFFVYELLHSRWTDIGGLPVVSIFENPLYGVDGLVKRVADVCLAGLFLLIAAIPMSLIALAIKLTSPGPVFFRQQRYGLDGRQIKVWKFRSMRVCEDGPNVHQATRNDPRVTPIGAMLRKSSLDELPQLFNVLDGSMSLVGPRPHANTHNELYRQTIHGYMLRHKVKPGITGLAQVNGWRGETDTLYKMQKRIEFDHQYIRQWSPWLDMKILVKTIFTVLLHRNAY